MTPESLTTEIIQRFWGYVKKSEECWEWQGHRDKDGYGKMRVGRRQLARSNRIAWMVNFGKIPKDLFVLHRCDNPPCVRPDHLFLGTARDNVIDKITKGRNRPQMGEARHNAKLTSEMVTQIVKEYCPRVMTQKMLAEKYGVSQGTISHILRGGHWKHIERAKVIVSHKAATASSNRAAKKISSEIAAEIRAQYAAGGVSQQKLGEVFGVNQRMVSNIVLGKAWPNS